jgi:predicted O-methyltransferase YrrM
MAENQNFQDVEKFRRLPSLAIQIISFLDLYITKKMRVFEWGSGGSTIFFAQRAKETISIEHMREWHTRISEALVYAGIDGECDLRLVTRDLVRSLEAEEFKSSQPLLRNVTFMNYVKAIDEFEDESFDVVLVDGRARASCITRAVPKIKPGGILVVDDSARPQYQKALSLDGWHRSNGIGPIPYMPLTQLAQTSVLIKP